MDTKRALLSVWDKSGLEALARFLHEHSFTLLSTGGTAKAIISWNLPVTAVQDITGQPTLMEGRLKSLDPLIFGPILADRDHPQQMDDLESLGQVPIDVVVVNLYPFAEMLRDGRPREELIEYIDIGGPSLLRAAAKNHRHVVVLSHPEQYGGFMAQYKVHKGELPQEYRESLAAAVYRLTAEYDSLISDYLSTAENGLPIHLNIRARRHQTLRYGENPHQHAAFYLRKGQEPPWKQLHGKDLSYNNYADVETAQQIVQEFDEPSVAIIKHANPCGFAVGESLKEAYGRALSTDPVSSFGGIVGLNRPVDEGIAQALAEIFLECIIAPSFTDGAMARLCKKKNLRLLEGIPRTEQNHLDSEIRNVAGGYLVQDKDHFRGEADWKPVTDRLPGEDEMEAMRLGWKLVRFVKSNAIVFSNNTQLLGVGAGQMSRVDAVALAGKKAVQAELDLTGAAMASDAFFPFPDGIEEAARLGITAVIQPGSSVRDHEVIKAAVAHGMTMIFTNTRHFRH
ncbi:bifunctional phosphoribosylaminoimidazolecarboxamide formyltransferase/IMP cyclohydrolase [Candidatus Neomarinimicrobiota bacterium]